MEKIRKEILSSPRVLSSVLGFKNNWHQIEWYSRLANPENKKMVILAPREHSKSTCFSVVYPLWEILKNRRIRIIIVSNSASQSEAFLRQVSSIIENNKSLQSVFGNLKPELPEKWSAREIIVNRVGEISGQPEEKDPTISTVGTGGAILSKRADIIICDDILNKENTKTPEQRKKVKEWFSDILLPVLVSNGRLIWVSTAFHSKDLSRELLENPLYDFKKIYKAIYKEADNQELWDKYKEILFSDEATGKKQADTFYYNNKEEMDKGADVLWSGLRDYKNLYDRRIEVGTRSFNLMYQNDPRNEEDTLFKEDWIDQCADEGMRLIPAYDDATDVYDIAVRTQGVDLGVKEDANADETVIFSLGKTRKNKFIMMNATYGNWSPALTRQNIAQAGYDIKPHLILVESNAYQASLQMDMKELTTLPIKGFQTTSEKYDEVLGINGLAVGIENGQWILPADPSHPKTKAVFEKLKDAMLDYVPGQHTPDILIAMWIAWVAIRNLESKSTIKSIKSSGQYQSIQAGI
jgi:hypothetical protein